MNNCNHLKQKLNRTLQCKRTNKIINIRECNNCKYKNINQSKMTNLKRIKNLVN